MCIRDRSSHKVILNGCANISPKLLRIDINPFDIYGAIFSPIYILSLIHILTQASTLPGQGVSPLTRWGGCPQPAKGRCPLTPVVCYRPCTPAQRAGCPLYSRTGEAGFHRRSGVCQFHRLRIRTFAPIGEKLSLIHI